MNEALARLARSRARDRCEYCRIPQDLFVTAFEIDHIIARKHKGHTTSDNLALACVECNRSKGTNIAGIDPISDRIIRLFNPRKESWKAHFEWNGPFLIGQTRIGRATIEVLDINDPISIMVRQELIDEGVFY